jgi:AAA+ ATPase superfamily predicted ATPase
MAFFNRERELEQLEAAWHTVGSALVTLWGRRRVGKSTLLSRFATGKRALYLYGTRLAERDILADLARQAAEVFDEPYLRAAPFPTWDAALDYVAERARDERLLLVLDEFPYLCEATPSLDTLIQRWWDRVHGSSQLAVVLAGSGLSFMEGLTGVRGPLHGRRTGQVEVHPFDYLDAARFFPHLEPADRVRAYACFGGIPAYLQHWTAEGSLAGQVQQTILSPGHALFTEAEELLRTEFHQEALYASILRAVATGEQRPSDIARAVGKRSADEIFDHLRRLQDLRFLRREVPVTELERARTQRVLYRLADPYLRFWFRFVSPFRSFIQLGNGRQLWAEEIAPALDEFVARTTWEEVCVQHLWRRQQAGQLGVQFAQLGRWWNGQDEIDLVGMWGGRVTLVGECKWTAAPVDVAVLSALRQKAAKLPIRGSALWVLASRSGFDSALLEQAEAGDVLLLTPEDLYSDGLAGSTWRSGQTSRASPARRSKRKR